MTFLNELEQKGFNIVHGMISNIPIHLINGSSFDIEWALDNIKYRSSIWTDNNEPVSLGLKKFTNWGERSDIFPLPTTLQNTTIIEKVDGSCIIISKYCGELIIRTRGTIDATIKDNGQELLWLKDKYPNVFNNTLLNSEKVSIICEWTTPSNKIIIDYGKQPDFKLLNVIWHKDYRYFTQKEVDECARLWNIPRPQKYQFKDTDQMFETVQHWINQEGICIYYNNDQHILKLKSFDYLRKHAFKSNATFKNIMELYFQWNQPNRDTMIERIQKEYDYECYLMVQSLIETLYLTCDKVNHIIDNIKRQVIPLRFVSRKDAAINIIGQFKQNGTSNIAFNILDGKDITVNEIKKLILQVNDDKH